MKAKITISPMLLKSVASLYTDPNRVIMEYVDNAIDAAEVFYDKTNERYSKLIEITITLDGRSHEYARITIQDNSTGISNLSDLVTKVGNSSKLNDKETNGQFGFGIYSFIAICDTLVISSRLSNSSVINRVELNSRMFEAPDADGIKIEEENSISSYSLNQPKEDCWTIFKLEDFNKQAFKDLNVKTLQTEIESHFELILSRNNIIIKIIDKNNNKEYVCNSFDYNKHDGEIFQREITTLEKTKSRKLRTKTSLSIPGSLKIKLKVYKNRMLGRKPVFVIKGRRIAEISSVKAFRTNSKSAIWSHPNITGYVDVTGILEPNISRDDFKANNLAKALFQKLAELESEIKEFLSAVLKTSGTREFRELGDLLSKSFNKLSNNTHFKDLLNFDADSKYHEEEDKTVKIRVPKEKDCDEIIEEKTSTVFSQDEQNSNGDSENSASPNGNSSVRNNRKMVNIVNVKIKNQTQTGVNIVIDCENDPPLDAKEKALRSSLINRQIVVYKKHPMFEERIKTNITGQQTISSELLFYISIEVLTQIKLFMFNNRKSYEDINRLFNTFNEALYAFINDITGLTGKNLSELTNLKRV